MVSKEFTIEDEDIIRSELELLSQVGHFFLCRR